jgi:hypothetical protein
MRYIGVNWNRDRQLILITIASLMYYLILFLTVPMAVQLMYAIVCDNIQGGSDCDTSAVSSKVAGINLVLGLFNNIPSFLLSGFYASLADRYGRKFCLILPTFGYSAYVAVLLYQAIRRSSGSTVSLLELELCTGLGLFSLGISGSFTTYQMSLFSYAADITDKDKTEAENENENEIEDGNEMENNNRGSGGGGSTSTSSTTIDIEDSKEKRIALAGSPMHTTSAGSGTGTYTENESQDKDASASTNTSRGVVYSLLECSLFFSKTLGPLFSGLYAEGHGYVGPLLVSATMCGLLLLFSIFVLPETREQ